MVNSHEVLIMVLQVKLTSKVKQRVALFVKNRWSLNADEAEAKAAFHTRDTILALAKSESRELTVEERETVSAIDKEFLAVKRGLSQVHYDQWEHPRLSMSRNKQAKYDADLIRQGLLLESGGIRQFRKKNRYAQAAAKLAATG
jgi:hypothetical protein